MSSHSTIAVTLLLLGTWAAASNAACCNSNQIAYFCQNTAIGDGAVVVASSSGCSCDASSCLNSFYANGNVRPGYSAMSNPDTDIRNAMDTAQAVCDATLELGTPPINRAQLCVFQISTAEADPHMMGFDGQPFEFQGFHNGVFTLVTHRRNEVNVLLNDLGHTDATFITAVAIVHPGNRVAVSIDNDRTLHVEVNGEPLNGQHFANTTARVAADLRVVGDEQHAVVVTPDLRVNVEVVKGASHLDVQITLGTLQAVHGILGRTAMQARGDSQLGDESEYVASDLFATDSLRSLYEASATGALDEEASVRGHRLTGKDVRIARRLSKL